MTDILQFAGLALIFFGVLKHYFSTPSPRLLIGLGLCFALLNHLLLDVPVDNFFGAALSGLFWGSNPLSFFPFLTWIVYPIAGYVFGTYLIRAADKSAFYAAVAIVSAGLLVPLYLLFADVFHVTILLDGDPYYHHGLLVAILFLLFVLIWIGLLFFVTHFFGLPALVHEAIERWSRNVTEIYFIHWILIGWLMILIGMHGLGLLYSSVTFLAVAALSDALASVYVTRKAPRAVAG